MINCINQLTKKASNLTLTVIKAGYLYLQDVIQKSFLTNLMNLKVITINQD
jgi:hypothetical protein